MTNYIKWDIINAYLTIPNYNEFEVLKQVYNALRAVNIRYVFKQKVCTVEIKDHKADLPDDMIILESLAHLVDHKHVHELTNECPECTKVDDNTYPNVIQSSGQQVTAIMPLLPYYFLKTNFYRRHFVFLRPRNKAFAAKYSCKYCPNLNSDCEHTYDILPELNQVNTHTIKEGILCISYLALAENEFNELLIPNDAALFEVIAAYVKYKYWEVEKQMADYMNYNRCNSEYTTAQREYVVKKRNYIGDKALENIDHEGMAWLNQGRLKSYVRDSFNYRRGPFS